MLINFQFSAFAFSVCLLLLQPVVQNSINRRFTKFSIEQTKGATTFKNHNNAFTATFKMHRLALRTTRQGSQLPPFSRAATRSFPIFYARRTYASSSPKEAEGPSAQSGGSRSKDAAEDATADSSNTNGLADPPAKGRTGGGEPLSSSSNPPPKPKITNASVPGEGRDRLTKEQQEEVDRHNAEFEKKHDRASAAGEDKVDKGFWQGHGGRD